MTTEPKPYGKNMLLHTSYWGEKDTFKLMPVSDDCPFTEVIYDPGSTLLVVIGKHATEKFQFIPKLDENGDVRGLKGKSRPTGKSQYMEQRVSMQMLHEYYLVTKEEQIAFINQFAVNADTYDYQKYLRDLAQEASNLAMPEKSPIVGTDGIPLKVVN